MIRRLHIPLLAALTISLLFGCAAATLESEGLKTPIEPKSARLETGTSYMFEKSEVGVLPGTFTLELESSSGQYFQADVPSVWWKAGRKVFLLKKAGIWIPFNGSLPPRLYFYNHAGHSGFDSFDELIASRADLTRPNTSVQPQADGLTGIVVDTTLRASPGVSPLQAGVGAAIATGVVLAIVEQDRNVPRLHPAPSTSAFGDHLKSKFLVLSTR